MDYRIAGRVALIVGGSKGIGLEVARYLAAEGALVAIVARTPKLRTQARTEYEALLAKHPLAFASHAARFFLTAGAFSQPSFQ